MTDHEALERIADSVIRGIYRDWHACGLREAERDLPAGTLCDDCQAGIKWRVAQFMDLYRSSAVSEKGATEVKVIDPYVMDLVRKHGATMTNSEIVQRFHDDERRPSGQCGPRQG